MLKATQADREAAAEIIGTTELRPIVLSGMFDAHQYVQAFAAHRIAAEARAGKLADALGKIAKGEVEVFDSDLQRTVTLSMCESEMEEIASTALAEYNGEGR